MISQLLILCSQRVAEAHSFFSILRRTDTLKKLPFFYFFLSIFGGIRNLKCKWELCFPSPCLEVQGLERCGKTDWQWRQAKKLLSTSAFPMSGVASSPFSFTRGGTLSLAFVFWLMSENQESLLVILCIRCWIQFHLSRQQMGASVLLSKASPITNTTHAFSMALVLIQVVGRSNVVQLSFPGSWLTHSPFSSPRVLCLLCRGTLGARGRLFLLWAKTSPVSLVLWVSQDCQLRGGS